MNSQLNGDHPAESSWFDSRDSVIIVSDAPGDSTVRPMTPARRQVALAELERFRRWEELLAKSGNEKPGVEQ
jgi:hypothetical protein